MKYFSQHGPELVRREFGNSIIISEILAAICIDTVIPGLAARIPIVIRTRVGAGAFLRAGHAGVHTNS